MLKKVRSDQAIGKRRRVWRKKSKVEEEESNESERKKGRRTVGEESK